MRLQNPDLTPAEQQLLSQARRASKARIDVPSPCVSVCQMQVDTGWCAGCWRSLEEIAQWGSSSPDFKREVWARIAQRIEQRK